MDFVNAPFRLPTSILAAVSLIGESTIYPNPVSDSLVATAIWCPVVLSIRNKLSTLARVCARIQGNDTARVD